MYRQENERHIEYLLTTQIPRQKDFFVYEEGQGTMLAMAFNAAMLALPVAAVILAGGVGPALALAVAGSSALLITAPLIHRILEFINHTANLPKNLGFAIGDAFVGPFIKTKDPFRPMGVHTAVSYTKMALDEWQDRGSIETDTIKQKLDTVAATADRLDTARKLQWAFQAAAGIATVAIGSLFVKSPAGIYMLTALALASLNAESLLYRMWYKFNGDRINNTLKDATRETMKLFGRDPSVNYHPT